MSTLLTPYESPEEIEEREQQKAREEEALDALSILLRGFLDAYKNGDLTFKQYCRHIQRAVSAEDVPKYKKYKHLGGAVDEALKCCIPERDNSSKRAGSNWMQDTIYDLVRIVRKREGLPINRNSKTKPQTAFERTAEILNFRGVDITPSIVEKLYLEQSKKVRSKSK